MKVWTIALGLAVCAGACEKSGEHPAAPTTHTKPAELRVKVPSMAKAVAPAPAEATPGAALATPVPAMSTSAPTADQAPVAFDQMPAPGTRASCAVSKERFTVTAKTQSTVFQGKTYVFCCADCKPDFEKNPAKYAQPKS
jgi:YHS domain-containing protein